jgi:hypothetical protein
MLVVYFQTKEEGGSVDELLEGSWLYDSEFPGAVSSARLYKNGERMKDA